MKILHTLGKMILASMLPTFLYAQVTVELKLSKNKLYVGESLKATIVLEYLTEDKIINREFDEFLANDFWIKGLDNSHKEGEGNKSIEQYEFIITPQKVGVLPIQSQLLRVAHREEKTNLIRWNKFYTNKEVIQVLPLPNNLQIQGKFTLETLVDTNNTTANKPVNFKVILKGYGNFEDVEGFSLNLPKQLVYNSKPNRKVKYENNLNNGELVQKFSIISNEDYTIPSIVFKYFDRTTLKMEELTTAPHEIKIKNNGTENDHNQYNKFFIGTLILIGIIIGIVISVVSFKIYKYKKRVLKHQTLYQKVKNAKSDKSLYKILLPYSNEFEFSNIITAIEQNIYYNSKNTINKKEILDIISKVL